MDRRESKDCSILVIYVFLLTFGAYGLLAFSFFKNYIPQNFPGTYDQLEQRGRTYRSYHNRRRGEQLYYDVRPIPMTSGRPTE